MKTFYKQYLALITVVATIAGCSNFEDINTNPDTTSKVNSSLLATGLITNMVTSANSQSSTFLQKQLFSTNTSPDKNQYNWLSNTSFSNIAYLTNGQKMVESAAEGYKNLRPLLFHEGLVFLAVHNGSGRHALFSSP